MIKSAARRYSERARTKRGQIFKSALNPGDCDRILDLGGGTGEHFAKISDLRGNVTIIDYSLDDLETARHRYGFQTRYLDVSRRLDISDGEFDIVFCSSVIEHVTGPREVVLALRDTRQFVELAWEHQKSFASEIRRIAPRYFVQTPNRHFAIESHSWLPGAVALLPRPAQMRLLEWTNRFWPKKTEPNWNLLTPNQMRTLFPDAEIILEKSFGLTKSIIALRR